jgi:oligoendopeptidase F
MSSVPTSARGVFWDLKDLYAAVDDPQIEADIKRCLEAAAAFADQYRGMFKGASAPPASRVLSAVQELERISEILGKLGSYAGLLTAVDNLNPDKRRLDDRIQQIGVDVQNRLMFFELEWLEVGEDVAKTLMDASELANYRHYLASARRYKPYTLTEPEELLWNQRSLTARSAWVNLFDEFTASLEYHLDYNGEKRTLTQPALLALSYEQDRGLRKAAQECLYTELAKHEVVLSNIFNAITQDHALGDQVRQYESPMASRNLSNEVSQEVVSRMLETAEANYRTAHDYYRLKARMLGLGKLATYDQYAPVALNMPSCLYDRGRDTVLTAFEKFDPSMREIASKFFDDNWIDAEVRPGKRGGAFSASTVPSVHPYIMLNWTDRLRDVSTMAHELGHGIHQYLSRQQTYLNFHHPLTVAETASVFAEFLTFDYVMKTETNAEVRLGLLCSKIEDAFATVFRQNVLTRFEQAAHAARRTRKLDSDEICQHWWDANHALYGDAVEMLDLYRWGWAYIPHFIHTPFYCYAYVFGELLVLSLYRMYREEGAPFVPRYLELLKSGSSAPPDELLKRVGADITDAGFWQKGLDVLRDMVNQAVALADELKR